MQYVIIGAVVASAILVFVALARGLYHFSQGNVAEGDGPVSDNQIMQNRMMLARVKWQAITVLLLVALAIAAGVR